MVTSRILNGLTSYKERNILNEEIATNALVTYSLREDALSTATELQRQGYTIVLLTGGFRDTAEHIAEKLNIKDYLYVTDITFNKDGGFDTLESRGEEGQTKLQLAREYCDAHAYKLEDAIAVGDSSNDIPLFNAVGRSLAFSWCKDEVKYVASDVIENLADIPNILKSGGNI